MTSTSYRTVSLYEHQKSAHAFVWSEGDSTGGRMVEITSNKSIPESPFPSFRKGLATPKARKWIADETFAIVDRWGIRESFHPPPRPQKASANTG